jgi:ATP-binding cassette, subfamily C, bacterial
MSQNDFKRGSDELNASRRDMRGLLAMAFVFSIFVNVLMLTGPLYMLQVYDRVLGSQSVPTLWALTALMAFLFLIMGILDYTRGRIMARIGARMQERLDRRVFAAAMRRMQMVPGDPLALAAQRDLEAIQRLWASPVLIAVFDIPWAPMFIAAIFVFHEVLGWLAVGGGLFLIAITILNQWMTKEPLQRANAATLRGEMMSDAIKQEAEAVQALGMTNAAFDRWQTARKAALLQGIAASDVGGAFGAISKTFRQFLQSLMLGAGAYLVLKNEMGSGAMITGSILLGRALQPIEMAIGQWALVTRAQEGRARLSELLTRVQPDAVHTELPRPRAILEAQSLTVVPPGEAQAVLRMVSFRLEPGQAMGVIGPSGAGKSSLARALIGAWKPAGGKVRLDGASLDQYDPDRLGSYIGYLPQRITLFEGTIAENIARLQKNPDGNAVVEAARKAAAHEMITKLPDGYDTRVQALGGRLSGGQIQRIGLARALFGDPMLLVLDEPNSNLDNEGSVALNQAIAQMKANGRAILIMAHRPAAIQECELLLVLEDGTRRAFGPRDQVLREMVKNHSEIVRSVGPGGVS